MEIFFIILGCWLLLVILGSLFRIKESEEGKKKVWPNMWRTLSEEKPAPNRRVIVYRPKTHHYFIVNYETPSYYLREYIYWRKMGNDFDNPMVEQTFEALPTDQWAYFYSVKETWFLDNTDL